MLIQQNTDQLNDLLTDVGVSLDITEAQYKTVVDRYTAVGNHLAKEDSELAPFKPEIKPQGSFLLGTMVRPIVEDDDLDVDLVCRLTGKLSSWTQYDVKNTVGDHIKDDADYKRMLDQEGNRCWTLIYHEASKFHLDILPAIIEESQMFILERSFSAVNSTDINRLSIRITDKRLANYRTDTNTTSWLKSNPWGYAAWFKDRARLEFEKSFSIREAVEPLPEYREDKEPLVRVVQILKRHRDIMFGGDIDKPISIVITTLAALAYEKETNIIAAICNILARMDTFIEERYDSASMKTIKWISNPVNAGENFADKWVFEPRKQQYFFDWLEKAKADFNYLKTADIGQAYRYLKALLGSRPINEAVKRTGIERHFSDSYSPMNYEPSLLTVPHRQQPIWPLNLRYNVEVHGRYKSATGKNVTITATTIVPKGCDIYFTAATNVPKPFEVYWQIVNTGEDAQKANGLRGGIFRAKTAGKGGLNQKEYSQYEGLHWAECFIVKDGVCVARSSEFFVNID